MILSKFYRDIFIIVYSIKVEFQGKVPQEEEYYIVVVLVLKNKQKNLPPETTPSAPMLSLRFTRQT